MDGIANIRNHDEHSRLMAFIKDDPDTKGNLKSSGLEMLKTSVAGLAGAATGAAIGRPSLLVGLGVIFAGHYYNSAKLTALGTGILTTGAFKASKGMSGTPQDGIEGVKERVKAFRDDVIDRLYVDKIKSIVSRGKGGSNEVKGATEGAGDEISYFNANRELDMSGLDAIQSELEDHAMQFEQRQFGGSDEDFSEVESRPIY